MKKLENNTQLKINFFEKEYIFEKVNPFTVKISSKDSNQFASISGEIFVDMTKEFYDKPYLIKFNNKFLISPKSVLKFFLEIPLITKLTLKSQDKTIEIDKNMQHNRMGWYGEVSKGILCNYVEARFSFDIPYETKESLMPLRIINKDNITKEITKIMIESENLFLAEGDNGMFTNKVYIIVISSNEFSVKYGTDTTTKVVNPHTVIDKKISVARTMLTKFDKFGIARELGL